MSQPNGCGECSRTLCNPCKWGIAGGHLIHIPGSNDSLAVVRSYP